MSANSNKTSGNLYFFEDLEIDSENFCVRKAGEQISLTPRAFDVLLFLIENNGRVVEKQFLFENIWKDAFVNDNALTKIIREIRLAIDDDANQPRFIETVPKRGYRFIANAKNVSDIKVDRTIDFNEAVPKNISPKSSVRKKLLLAGATILCIAASTVGFIIFSEWHSELSALTAPIDSVAVLPFENKTEDADIEFFSNRLTENLINSLSRIPNLRVLPRNTITQYKNNFEDPHVVGRALRVRAVLSGKVIRHEQILSIQVELVAADRKAQLWGRQYNHQNPVDIAELQAEISRDIAAYLKSRSELSTAASSIPYKFLPVNN